VLHQVICKSQRPKSDSTTLSAAPEIRCRRACGIGGWYTWSFKYPHNHKSYEARSDDLGGQRMGPARHIQAFCISDAILIDGDRSATRGWYVTISVANENFTNVLTIVTFSEWLQTGFGLLIRFIAYFDTARDYNLQFNITRTLVSTVTSSLPLFGSGFQRRTFPFLRVPKLSPASATSF
jgi:hypothetical protein